MQNDPKSLLATGFALQPYMKAEEGVRYAAEHDFDFCYLDGSLHSDFAKQWTRSRIDNLIDICDETKVKPIFHGNYKVPLSSDVEEMRLAAIEYVKREIDICAKLTCPLIVHGGAIVEPRKTLVVKNLALESLIKSLIVLKKYAEEAHVELWLENLSYYPEYKPFSYVGTTMTEFAYILNNIDVKMFFDFGHANVNAEIPVEEFFKQFHGSIAAISVSNNSGKLDQHLGIHKGSINYSKILKLMIELKWKGIVGFETRNIKPSNSIREFTTIVESLISKEAIRI